jgi:cupin 2 domain-containing protein
MVPTDTPAIGPGPYRHYKGKDYSVLGIARHSETLEELVVYRQEYGERGLWVRPKEMFLENVLVGGQEVPRFRRVAQIQQAVSTDANLFQNLPASLSQELFQTLLTEPSLRIERIVSHGHASPPGFWYDQDQNEWVVLLKGAARLQFEGEPPLELKPGDFADVPAHKRHRVDWTTPDEPTIWLAMFYGGPKVASPSNPAAQQAGR